MAEALAGWRSAGAQGVTTAYDGFGRVTSSTLAMAGTSRTLGHQYDASGNRIRITHPDGAFFTHEYDGLNRFLRVRENGGDPLATATYDAAGRLARSGWAATTDHAYDDSGRLRSQTHDLVGTGGDQVIGLTYNPAGQLLSRSGTNDAYAWTGAKTVNRPYSVNGQNQYTAAGGASFAYDANGNLTSDGASSFVYDVENRLVSASGEKSASLVCDPLGRLFQTSGGAAGAMQFLYGDDALIGEYDTGGTMVHRYVHGPAKGVDDPLIWYHNAAAGWRRALVSDQQGSVIAVADMYGNPFAINAYDEYGIPDARNQGRFQYTGQAWIPELGMYYYKARFYSPTLGRFLQVDPIGYEGGINLYIYVDNDPANRQDPTGLCDGENCPMNYFHPNLDQRVKGVKQEIGARIAEGSIIGVTLAGGEFAVAYGLARVGWALSAQALGAAQRLGTEGFRRTAVGAATKISNIIKNNGKFRDFLGAVRESRGARTGFDHVAEMKNSIKGLKGASESLAGSLKNPSLSPGVRSRMEGWKKAADTARERMEAALKLCQRDGIGRRTTTVVLVRGAGSIPVAGNR